MSTCLFCVAKPLIVDLRQQGHESRSWSQGGLQGEYELCCSIVSRKLIASTKRSIWCLIHLDYRFWMFHSHLEWKSNVFQRVWTTSPHPQRFPRTWRPVWQLSRREVDLKRPVFRGTNMHHHRVEMITNHLWFSSAVPWRLRIISKISKHWPCQVLLPMGASARWVWGPNLGGFCGPAKWCPVRWQHEGQGQKNGPCGL